MPQAVYQHTFANGLTLLAERMEHVRSAAVNFLVPGGCAYDPAGQLGIASVLADLITRGAGSRSTVDGPSASAGGGGFGAASLGIPVAFGGRSGSPEDSGGVCMEKPLASV